MTDHLRCDHDTGRCLDTGEAWEEPQLFAARLAREQRRAELERAEQLRGQVETLFSLFESPDAKRPGIAPGPSRQIPARSSPGATVLDVRRHVLEEGS